MDFVIGQVLKSRKPHPCGGCTWQVTRIGADLKMTCQTCGHVVMMDRFKAEKFFREDKK